MQVKVTILSGNARVKVSRIAGNYDWAFEEAKKAMSNLGHKIGRVVEKTVRANVYTKQKELVSAGYGDTWAAAYEDAKKNLQKKTSVTSASSGITKRGPVKRCLFP